MYFYKGHSEIKGHIFKYFILHGPNMSFKYHSGEVNVVDIIHLALLSIISSKHDCPPVIYRGEGVATTWRRSLSSDGRTAPHTCSEDRGDN